MHLVASHAVRAGAGGDLLVQAQIVGPRWSADEVQVWLNRENSITFATGNVPVALVKRSVMDGHTKYGPRVDVQQPSPVQQTVPLTVAFSAADLVSACATLVADIFAEFAEPGPMFLRQGGWIDLGANGGLEETLTAWAAVNRVALADDV